MCACVVEHACDGSGVIVPHTVMAALVLIAFKRGRAHFGLAIRTAAPFTHLGKAPNVFSVLEGLLGLDGVHHHTMVHEAGNESERLPHYDGQACASPASGVVGAASSGSHYKRVNRTTEWMAHQHAAPQKTVPLHSSNRARIIPESKHAAPKQAVS